MAAFLSATFWLNFWKGKGRPAVIDDQDVDLTVFTSRCKTSGTSREDALVLLTPGPPKLQSRHNNNTGPDEMNRTRPQLRAVLTALIPSLQEETRITLKIEMRGEKHEIDFRSTMKLTMVSEVWLQQYSTMLEKWGLTKRSGSGEEKAGFVGAKL
ncbi:unnamed protein product [Pleuronectes platessa]|uniref:Uncharacterized protein n=1 Tax=Pleuronectes platessa TaxID=8262 RepID=A0A9N7UA90_PLEPL|nr:unnamed protein product [Pleuronectes platessa]